VLGRVSAGAGDVEEVTFSDAAQDQAQDTFADDQVWVADSATAGTPRSVPDCTDTGGNHLNYTAASNSFSCGTTGDGGGWPTGKLTSPVAVAVNASYVTVFTITPGVSKSNVLDFTILHTASSLLVGVQFRVRSADAGNVGSCTFTHFGINATVQSSVGTFTVGAIAIAAAPVDTAALAASSLAINRVDVKCAFASDGTPGDVILEAQLETGTTSINILTGSYYNLITN
jgi:hypothetical protein